MRLGALIGSLVGLGLSAWLLESYGVWRILDLLAQAGWLGILTVIAFHLIQILLSALGWRAIAGPTRPRPNLPRYTTLRWIREAVNNLLPVAQIGGELVAARLLQQRGVKLARAIAGTVADLTLEMVTQILFTLIGLILLWRVVGDSGVVGDVVIGLLVAVLLAAGVFGALWLGLAAAVERGLMRLGRSMRWAGTTSVEGLHDALLGCYRAPGRVAAAALCHLLSWLLGSIEVCLALHFLGHDVGIGTGLIIESLGQAVKSSGFVVPGAVGVQEGGYAVIGHIFGLPPQIGIAVSLIKRVREVTLGVPALIGWHRIEARAAAAPSKSLPGVLQ